MFWVLAVCVGLALIMAAVAIFELITYPNLKDDRDVDDAYFIEARKRTRGR